MRTSDREDVLALMQALGRTDLATHLILAGSSAIHAISDKIPALTEDIAVIVDAEWLREHETHVLSTLAALGFVLVAATCTFVSDTGSSLDLVGYSRRDRTDRVGGGARIAVMVFADLSTILTDPRAVVKIGGGALAAAKLLTLRLDKGAKDKLQALLLVDEHRDAPASRACSARC